MRRYIIYNKVLHFLQHLCQEMNFYHTLCLYWLGTADYRISAAATVQCKMLIIVLCFSDVKVSSYEMFLRKPTLLWFVRDLGLTTQTGMSFLCIIGICVAMLGISIRAWRNFAPFLTMWFLYFSLYQVSDSLYLLLSRAESVNEHRLRIYFVSE